MRTLCSHLLAGIFVFATVMPILPAAADDHHGDNDGPGISGDHDDGGPGHDDGDDDHHDGDGGGSGDVTCDSARCAILAEVETSCPCDTSSHLRYLACVLRVTNRLAEHHQIPRRCSGRVLGCALASTCGRPSAVACSEPRFGICDVRHSRCVGSGGGFCQTFRDCPLPPKCDIESSSRHCQDEGGLVLPQTSCCGDCQGGTTTSTTSSTVSSTSVSSTSVSSTSVSSTSTSTSTTVPLCGNGVIDANEQCDPPGSATCPSGSASGALLCQSDCTCPAVSSSTTSSTSTSSSTTEVTETSTSTTEVTETSTSVTETTTSTSTSSTITGSPSGAFVSVRPGRWPVPGLR